MDRKEWQRHYDYNVPTTLRYPNIPFYKLLLIGAKTHADKAAYDFFGATMTFWELREAAVSMANALIDLGLKKGDRVAIHLPNCPQYMIAYMATLIAGGVVTNLNPMYSADEMKHIIKGTSVSTLFTFDTVLENLRMVLEEVDVERVIVTKMEDFIGSTSANTSKELKLDQAWHHFSEVLAAGSPEIMPQIDLLSDDPAMIQFTGGTTGVPKGAVLTQANMIAATLLSTCWGSPLESRLSSDHTRSLSVLPFFHVYGAVVALSGSLYAGRTQVLLPRFRVEELLQTIDRFSEITFFPAVPTMIHAVLNAPGASKSNLRKKIGLLISGGGPLPTDLIGKIERMGLVYCEGWGMSETAASGISSPLLNRGKPGSIGVPVPDTDIRIVEIDDPQRDVKRGDSGELLIKSPTVMKEYWDNPEETAAQLKDGWLSTGDVVVMDEDGYLFLVDRKKDMIIAGGYNIYPREIDEVLFQHPKISEAVAVGLPDEYRGETIKAFVVLKPNEEATEDEIIGFCRKKLAAYKVPKSVVFRQSLPKSQVGKILRQVIRDEELGGNEHIRFCLKS